jgi:hypothetical protein
MDGGTWYPQHKLVGLLILHSHFSHRAFAFEHNFKQTGVMLSNLSRLNQADNVTNNETGLTKADQKIAVDRIIFIFNDPGSANVGIMPTTVCPTQDFRCCIQKPTCCIPKATIISVIDGEGMPLPFHGITNSKEVTFTFNSFIKIGVLALSVVWIIHLLSLVLVRP